MSCKENLGLTIRIKRGSKLLGLYPVITRLNGRPLNCKTLETLTKFKLIDDSRLHIKIDCENETAWVMAEGEDEPVARSVIHIQVDGMEKVSEAELNEIANKFAAACCAQETSTVITSNTVSAVVREKQKGPDLEIVRLEVLK